MYSGKAQIKKRIGQKGYYGEIALKADFLKEKGLKISFAETVGMEWRDAISGGIKYLYEKEISYRNVGLEVKVEECRSMIVDSSYFVFFYLTNLALSEALHLKNEITIDDRGNFVIPK